MLPPFLGMLLFLGTVAVVGLAAVVLVVGIASGKAGLRTLALKAGGCVAGGYAVFWLLGILLPKDEVLPPGEALRFCGLDCHLHVTVTGVSTGADLGVTVTFSSNAVREPEFPAELRFRLRDAAGHEFAPSNEVPKTPLQAGASWTHELHFSGAADAKGATLLVTWNGWLDYFVPGVGNPLAQRHRQLALPALGA